MNPASVPLDAEVRRLMETSEASAEELAEVSGMTQSWIYLFKKNKINAPNVRAMQRLYEYLTGQPLIRNE